ncbi:hypothetical protein AVEN_236234-1 [Araneus ventricosus]|uniref:Uncharacterized protein n=1 Tax=Araneus ventricosus TaxID=182803 RepID=A0A4Y2CC90_ARAVE|nr:hypothetical protein AVEN_236234-1 [Araneus ventricosus]
MKINSIPVMVPSKVARRERRGATVEHIPFNCKSLCLHCKTVRTWIQCEPKILVNICEPAPRERFANLSAHKCVRVLRRHSQLLPTEVSYCNENLQVSVR